jgi:hypothetical protein
VGVHNSFLVVSVGLTVCKNVATDFYTWKRTLTKLKRVQEVVYCLRDYTIGRKVAGWRPYKVNLFFIYLILTAALGPGVYSVSNRN